jgi:predicted GNAT family acetyltransferase
MGYVPVMKPETPRVVDNPSELRYEVWSGDALAGIIRYTRDDDVLTLVHTEVEPAFEGVGLGDALVAGALDDARARGKHVRPLCQFVASYIKHHPEYADVVAS